MEGKNAAAWQEAYDALTAYVSGNEAIRISPTSLRIPKPEREAFYSRVDDVVEKLAAGLAGERLTTANVRGASGK